MAETDMQLTVAYSDLLGPVLEQLEKIGDLDKLHLTSIAKIIETSRKDRLKIIFRAVASGNLGEVSPAVLVTQDFCAEVGSKQLRLREHIVLYEEQRTPERTRFYIAHELGHILLHQKLFDDETRRVDVPRERVADLGRSVFAIRFEPVEEMQSDLFAAVLAHQRPAPRGRRPFEFPCLRELKKLTHPRRKLCHSAVYQVVRQLDVSCLSHGNACTM